MINAKRDGNRGYRILTILEKVGNSPSIKPPLNPRLFEAVLM